MQTRSAAATVAMLCLVLAGIMCAKHDPPSRDEVPEPSQRRQVVVPLLGFRDEIKGLDARTRTDPQSLDYVRVSEPAYVMIRFPDQRSRALNVRSASIATYQGVVAAVDLLPLTKSLPYTEAIKELECVMQTLGVTPDQELRRQMAGWPEDAPGFDPAKRPGFYPHTYRARMSLPNQIGFDVKLRPANDGGWFLVLTFAAEGDEARKAAGLTTQPSTKAANG